MSAHRDLMNAQQALNESVERLRNFVSMVPFGNTPHTSTLITTMCERFDAFDIERKRLDAPGGSAPRNTSINAGHVNLANKESLRRNVVFAVVANQAQFGTGMTVAELKGRLRKEHSSVSSAISELVKRGWLRDSGIKRLTQHQQPAIVWEPTDLAIAQCRKVALEVTADGG